MCVTFVVFTDCESCTRPISTNPGSMEAGERGLMRGARFVAICLEVVAVVGLIRVSRCVFGGAGFFCFFVFRFFCSFERTRPAASMRPPLASFTSVLVLRQGRGSEATKAVFCLQAKKPLHTGVRAVRHDLIMLLNKIIIPTFPPSIRVIVLVLVRRMVI